MQKTTRQIRYITPLTPRLWVRGFHLVEHKLKTRGYRMSHHRHTGHELVYVDHGAMAVNLTDQTLQMRTGDCLLIASKSVHRYRGLHNKPVQFLNIVFFGYLPAVVREKVIRMTDNERNILRTVRDDATIQQRYTNAMIVAKLNELFITIARRLESLLVAPPIIGTNQRHRRDRLVAAALTHLESHMVKPFNPTSTAKHVGISVPHLRAVMRQATGKSLRQHLINIRIEAARRLLMDSDASVKIVAHHVGYDSVPHFCNLFKRQTSMTPSQFARSLGR